MTNRNKNILIRSLDDVSAKFLFLKRNTPPTILPTQTEMDKDKLPQYYNVAENLQQVVIIAHPELLTEAPLVFINPLENKYEYITLVDFSEAPQLEVIDLSGYNGQPGCPIRIRVNDDYRVAEIWVSISSIDGAVSESGMARAEGNPREWVYNSTKKISFTGGRTIHINVTDVPGYLMRTP